MAKKLEKYRERQEKLSFFGKELVRRSKSACELCSASGVPLNIYEVPPAGEEPEMESLLFICGECMAQLENPKRLVPDHWRCLNNAVWSEIEAVQVTACRVLIRLAETEDWAAELLEQAYFDDEVMEKVRLVKL